MSRISILPFPPDRPDLCTAAQRFNQRLQAGGYGEFHLAERHTSRAYPKIEGRPVWTEHFLAFEDPPEVRGGYILRFQPWWCRGERQELVFLKMPVSEGVIDPKYTALGIEILQDVERRVPTVYALGMGGIQNKLPRIFKKLGWDVVSVPFFFRVCRASRVLRQVKPMRSTKLRSLLCDIAAFTGLGSLAFAFKQKQTSEPVSLQGITVTEEPDFGPWCDPIWAATHASYDWVGQRDSSTLPLLYQDEPQRFIRMHIKRDGKSIGWALALCTDMQGHKQFSNLRVASLIDDMALPEDAATVIQAATRHIEKRRPDIIVSNHQHAAWRTALSQAGFMSGPSNYALAMSPAAMAGLRSRGGSLDGFHLNRGDGDGPINL